MTSIFHEFCSQDLQSTQDEGWNSVFDLDEDGEVGFGDFLRFTQLFGA